MKQFLTRLATLPFEILDRIGNFYSLILACFLPTRRHLWLERQSRKNDQITETVFHKNAFGELRLTLFTPNWLCWDRSRTFSVKEPETLSWIDEFGGAGALFDIGANVGLYSLYYAGTKLGNVYAFEPSVFNLPILVKNVSINNLQSRVSIIPLPLAEDNKISNFRLTNTDAGEAYSSFGVDFGWDGEPFVSNIDYQLLGFSLDYLLKAKLIDEYPTMIKIDVDGIEHLILKGAQEVLRHPNCKTVLVEISKPFKYQQLEIEKILINCGFILDMKRNSEILSRPLNPKTINQKTINQIWVKQEV